MSKYCVIQEKGIIEERIYLLEDRLTIGRSPTNSISLADPTASWRHAVIYLRRNQAFLKDLDSHNGTFVNNRRIKSSQVKGGDIFLVGRSRFRLIQEDMNPNLTRLFDTQDLSNSGVYDGVSNSGSSKQFRMMKDCLAKAPVFSSLDSKGLEIITESARLVVFDRENCIIQQGYYGKSLYFILDGNTRLFINDYKGKEILIGVLTENQMFGELSYLTGVPVSASVHAVEQTVLVEVNLQAILDLSNRYPQIKDFLEKYHQEQIHEIEEKRKAAGLKEKRKHPRFTVQLPVSFAITPAAQVLGNLSGKIFRSVSKDMSSSGIKLQVLGHTIEGMPLGCQLKLRISLPNPWGVIQCLGVLKYIWKGKETSEAYYLGVEFLEMPEEQRKKLGEFQFG